MIALRLSSARIRRYPNGLIFELCDEDGICGFGEASPIARSTDSIDEAENALEGFAAQLPRSLTASSTLELCRALSAQLEFTPSSCCAAECAVLDLIARRMHLPLRELLTDEPQSYVDLNGLVRLDAPLEEQLADTKRHNYRVLKFKMPGRRWEEELEALRRARQEFPTSQFRIDANQAWPASSLAKRWDALSDLDIAYVEEPSPIADIPPGLEMPLALDESLARHSDAELAHLIGTTKVRALAVKPGEIGGILRALELKKLAQRHELSFLVTHFAGGPIELASTCELALAWADAACGLAPHSGLEAWPQSELPHLLGTRATALTAPGIGLSAEEMRLWL